VKDGVILLVEDNGNDEFLTLRELEKNGVANEIIVARDGIQALEYLFGQSGSAERDTVDLPQVVLLDLNLPKLDGLEALRRIRAEKRTRRLPVVILTSSDEDQDRIKAYNLGANGYVRKPVGFGEFGTAARQLGLRWLLSNQQPFRGKRWHPVS
jgi:two-component system response regulator